MTWTIQVFSGGKWVDYITEIPDRDRAVAQLAEAQANGYQARLIRQGE